MLIVSFTTWWKRVQNVPKVVDSILSNTLLPDKIVLNLSEQDFPERKLPKEVREYIDSHPIMEIIWHEDNMKVYKKFLPTLKKYPEATVIAIDDDAIYPKDFISDLYITHLKNPDNPVSGNDYVLDGIKYHCGCASLVEARFLDGWEKHYTENFLRYCPCDDVFYTHIALHNGYKYVRTERDYQRILQFIESNDNYSDSGLASVIPSRDVMLQIFHQRRSIGDTSFDKKPKKTVENPYGVKECTMLQYFDKHTRPLCFLGVMTIPRGIDIMKEMMGWLYDTYDVIAVHHDGGQFEYPPMKVMQEYIKNTNYIGPVLYVHTKGAYYLRNISIKTRRLWKYEFADNMQKYLDIVNVDAPMMATPYQGIVYKDNKHLTNAEEETINVPWFNGWMANSAAVNKMQIDPSEDRFAFEYNVYKGIPIVGTRKQNIDINIKEIADTMYEDLNTF